jgi:hypothetical protein
MNTVPLAREEWRLEMNMLEGSTTTILMFFQQSMTQITTLNLLSRVDHIQWTAAVVRPKLATTAVTDPSALTARKGKLQQGAKLGIQALVGEGVACPRK